MLLLFYFNCLLSIYIWPWQQQVLHAEGSLLAKDLLFSKGTSLDQHNLSATFQLDCTKNAAWRSRRAMSGILAVNCCCDEPLFLYDRDSITLNARLHVTYAQLPFLNKLCGSFSFRPTAGHQPKFDDSNLSHEKWPFIQAF